MSEENVQVQNDVVVPSKPSVGAKIKEWFRKKIVNLKRHPQNIALLFLAIASVYYMFVMYTIGLAMEVTAEEPQLPATGICSFISTLLSILVLVCFLNSFPKRKKPNIVFIIITFVMIFAIIGCDIGYYVPMHLYLIDHVNKVEAANAQPYVLAHIILLGIAAVVFALLPVYGKLIQKINTSVKLESATENMKGNIDIQED